MSVEILGTLLECGEASGDPATLHAIASKLVWAYSGRLVTTPPFIASRSTWIEVDNDKLYLRYPPAKIKEVFGRWRKAILIALLCYQQGSVWSESSVDVRGKKVSYRTSLQEIRSLFPALYIGRDQTGSFVADTDCTGLEDIGCFRCLDLGDRVYSVEAV